MLLDCCLPHKGTNFLANHNYNDNVELGMELLFTPQRY